MENIIEIQKNLIDIKKDIPAFLDNFYFSAFNNYNDYIKQRNVKIHFRSISNSKGKILIEGKTINDNILGLLYKGSDTESCPYIIVDSSINKFQQEYIIVHELTHLMMAETKDKNNDIIDFFIQEPSERYKNDDERIIDMLTLLLLIKKENLEKISEIKSNKEIAKIIGVEEYIVNNYFLKIKEIEDLFI